MEQANGNGAHVAATLDRLCETLEATDTRRWLRSAYPQYFRLENWKQFASGLFGANLVRVEMTTERIHIFYRPVPEENTGPVRTAILSLPLEAHLNI